VVRKEVKEEVGIYRKKEREMEEKGSLPVTA
jgi:hypothetical protein